mgnify:FL=1
MNSIICYKVSDITQDGIILEFKKNKIHINFDDCAKNFATENNIKCNKCVATRDITKLSFTFYTYPKTKLVFKRYSLSNIIGGNSAISKFFDLQKAIVEAGYTSYDFS